jgi:hypothetical protein
MANVIQGQRKPATQGVLRQSLISASVGIGTFAASQAVDVILDYSKLVSALLLSILMGGITMLVQFLVQFEGRLDVLEDAQGATLQDIRTQVERIEEGQERLQKQVAASFEDNFSRISRATEVFAEIQAGRVPDAEHFEDLLRSSVRVGGDAPEVLVGVAQRGMDQLTQFVKALASGNRIPYPGEDREWLIGLAESTRRSIDAISFPVIDGTDDGFWSTDLGVRYLALQREAIALREVRIRRIFVITDPDRDLTETFAGIRVDQHQSGVNVRTLDASKLGEELRSLIRDFILFDDRVSYELTPDVQDPPLKRTHLVVEPEMLQERRDLFDRLWRLAGVEDELPDPERETG